MPEYTSVPGWVDIVPLMCLECGASVAAFGTAREKHTEFHEKFDELVDWARAVSEIFVPKAAPPESNDDLFTGPGYEAHPGHDHEDCCK